MPGLGVTSDPDLHALALKLARQCRRVIQGCLREEEWADADREFYAIILMGLTGSEKEKVSSSCGRGDA